MNTGWYKYENNPIMSWNDWNKHKHKKQINVNFFLYFVVTLYLFLYCCLFTLVCLCMRKVNIQHKNTLLLLSFPPRKTETLRRCLAIKWRMKVNSKSKMGQYQTFGLIVVWSTMLKRNAILLFYVKSVKYVLENSNLLPIPPLPPPETNNPMGDGKVWFWLRKFTLLPLRRQVSMWLCRWYLQKHRLSTVPPIFFALE